MRSLDTFVYIIIFFIFADVYPPAFWINGIESNIFIESVEPVHKAKMIRSQM